MGDALQTVPEERGRRVTTDDMRALAAWFEETFIGVSEIPLALLAAADEIDRLRTAWDWLAANTTHAVLDHKTADRLGVELEFAPSLDTVAAMMEMDR